MRKYGISISLIIISFIISIIALPSLPNEMAIHWDYNGLADRTSSKLYGAFFGPVIMSVLLVLFIYMPKIDPKKNSYPKFQSSYSLVNNLLLGFLFIIHLISIAYNLGYNINLSSIMPMMIGVLFLIIGNYMPKFKHNYFVGIKSPWTLQNENVWNKTHRIGGRIFAIMGILMALTAFIEGVLKPIIFISVILIGTIAIYIISYFYYKKES